MASSGPTAAAPRFCHSVTTASDGEGEHSATLLSEGSSHIGLVALMPPTVLRGLLAKVDAPATWAPGLVQCCLVENGADASTVGARRRTTLGSGFAASFFQSGNAAGCSALSLHSAGASLLSGGLLSLHEAALLAAQYENTVIREELTATDSTADSAMWVYTAILDDVHRAEVDEQYAAHVSRSPFAGIGLQSMRTTIRVSAVSTDPFKAFVEFDVRYQIRTTTAAASSPGSGSFLPPSVSAMAVADKRCERLEHFLSCVWLRPLALSLNEFALNAAYPVLGVDSPSASVVAEVAASHHDGVAALGGAEQFRISVEHRAEYEQYDEALAQLQAQVPHSAGEPLRSGMAAFERLLGSWTQLVRQKAHQELALAMARAELAAARHVTAAATGSVAVAAEHVALAYDDMTANPALRSSNSEVDAAKSTPVGCDEPPDSPAAQPSERAALEDGHLGDDRAARGASNPPPASTRAERIDWPTLRRALCAGCVMSDVQMREVFAKLDTASKGWISAMDLRDLWAAIEDFGEFEGHTGVVGYLEVAKARQAQEAATPLREWQSSYQEGPSPKPVTERIMCSADRLGLSPAKACMHFDRLTADWVRKHLSHRLRRSARIGTPRRRHTDAEGAAADDRELLLRDDLRISFEEFCLFLLQLCRR